MSSRIRSNLPLSAFSSPSGPVGGGVDVVLMKHQHVDQSLPDGLFVFDHQNAGLAIQHIERLSAADRQMRRRM